MRDSVAYRIRDIVDECISDGIPVQEFLHTVRDAWTDALTEKIKTDDKRLADATD